MVLQIYVRSCINLISAETSPFPVSWLKVDDAMERSQCYHAHTYPCR